MGEGRGGGGRGRFGRGFGEGGDVDAVGFGFLGVVLLAVAAGLFVADGVDALFVEVFDFFGVLGVLFELELAGAEGFVGGAHNGVGGGGDGCGGDEVGHVGSHCLVLGPSSWVARRVEDISTD
jgi:hypothetical protein